MSYTVAHFLRLYDFDDCLALNFVIKLLNGTLLVWGVNFIIDFVLDVNILVLNLFESASELLVLPLQRQDLSLVLR